MEVIHDPVRWHLIGHLQTNKVKYIVDKAYLIILLILLHLAEKIQERLKKSRQMSIYLFRLMLPMKRQSLV